MYGNKEDTIDAGNSVCMDAFDLGLQRAIFAAELEADQDDWRLLDHLTNHGRPSHHSLHEASLRANSHCPCPPRGLPRFRSISAHAPPIGNLGDHSCGLHGNNSTMWTRYLRRVVIRGLHVRHGVPHKLLPRATKPQSTFHAHDSTGKAALVRQCVVLASDGNQALPTRPIGDHETGFPAETPACVGVHRLPLAVHPRWPLLLPQGPRTRGLGTFKVVHDASDHQGHSHFP